MSSGPRCAPSTSSKRCGRRARGRRDGRRVERPLPAAMRIVIAAVGRLKQGPERDLAERYRKRAADAGRSVGLPAVEVVEIRESRADSAERRMLEESIAIANVLPERAIIAILDERGESLNSAAFASRLQGWRAEGRPAAVFIIGSADGLAPT